jgi:phospholipase/lecithinase/hemolysin
VTNGYTWVEDLAADVNATIIDYAIGGAVVNVTLWPGRPQASDFVQQTNLFLSQNRVLDPKTTLYAAFFGINDYASSLRDGNQMPQAAVTYLALVDQLMASPTKAKYWLTVDDYGRGLVAETGDVYKNAIFAGLSRKKKLKYGFVDLYNLWNGVLGTSPGFAAFGYSSPGACTLSVNSSVGACSDPDHTFYWQPGHPSKQTHRIMADYVQQVLKEC